MSTPQRTLVNPKEMLSKSERVSKSATVTLNGPVETVFPLFGPIRERDWAYGWDPEIIFAHTSLVEQYMVFRTRATNENEKYFHWTITQYFPEQHLIEYTVSTENRIWFIKVECRENASQTLATISYTYTALTELGARLNCEALQAMFADDLKDWEDAINYYLKRGTQLVP